MNLLQETIDALIRHGVKMTDIDCVIVDGMGYPWEDFADVAGFEYAELGPTITVLTNDGSWLTRVSRDRREFWECHHAPKVRLATTVKLTKEMLLGS